MWATCGVHAVQPWRLLPPLSRRESLRLPAGKSLFLSLRNVYETLAVSAPTVVDAYRGTLTAKSCDDRLETWASRVVRNAEILLTVRG